MTNELQAAIARVREEYETSHRWQIMTSSRKDIRTILDALTWRPIAELPEKQTQMAVCFLEGDITVASISRESVRFLYMLKYNPTHFLPIPPPPEALP